MSARMDEGSPAALPSFSRCHVGSSILLSAASVKIRDDKLSAIAIGMLDRVAHADQLFDRRRRLLEHLCLPVVRAERLLRELNERLADFLCPGEFARLLEGRAVKVVH